MSGAAYVVDCLLDPRDLKMSREDFTARIVDPMLARLLKGFGEPGPDAKLVHFRMWMAPVTELQQASLYDACPDCGTRYPPGVHQCIKNCMSYL